MNSTKNVMSETYGLVLKVISEHIKQLPPDEYESQPAELALRRLKDTIRDMKDQIDG